VKAAAEPTASPFELWVDRVFLVLRKLGPAKVTLDAAADALGLETAADWMANDREAVRGLAFALTACDDSWRVIQVIRQLAPTDQQDRRSLRDLLLPTWVEPKRAALAAATMRRQSTHRQLILGSDDDFVAREHVNRAECCGTGLVICSPVAVDNEDPNGDALYAACVSEIENKNPMIRGLRGERFSERITTYGRRIILLIRPAYLDPVIVRLVVNQVQAEFPGVSALMLTDDADSLCAAMGLPAPQRLVPPVTGNELALRDGYSKELDLFVSGNT
jgi:hypothetical protein